MRRPAVRSRVDLGDDSGTTLIEVLLAMAILTVFMTIFTTAVLMMAGTTNKVQATSQSVEHGNTAYLRLDKTVRYATGISEPVRSATTGVWDVELASVVAGDGTTTDQCTQLRVAGGKLELRTWQPNGAGYVTGTLNPWRTLAANVTNGSAVSGEDVPFAVPAAASGSASDFRRLTVTLVTTGGPASSTTSSRTSSTFTAQNSTRDSSDVCTQVPVETAS